MMTVTESPLLDRWCRGRCDRGLPRRLAALGYLTHGPVVDALIAVDQLCLVLLCGGPWRSGSRTAWLAGYVGAAVPWGVRFGGPQQCQFVKNLALRPRPAAAGHRLDLAEETLLTLGLQLQRELQRHARYGSQGPQPRLRLPKLWAGFPPATATQLTCGGPELEAYARRSGRSPAELLRRISRVHDDQVLYPLAWVSHHWQQAATIFADLRRFPRRQIFDAAHPPEDLAGYEDAAEYDFLPPGLRRRGHRRRRRHRAAVQTAG